MAFITVSNGKELLYEAAMEVKQAIYNQGMTHKYTGEVLDERTVRDLIDAAIQAPTAMSVQPFAFVVVQNPRTLKRLSDRALDLMRHSPDFGLLPPPLQEAVADREMDVFHHAGTLIVICAKADEEHPDWECGFAAQNLMLAARSLGLGSCPIRFVSPMLDLQDVRDRLEIPEGYRPILPIVVGYPWAFPPSAVHGKPEVLSWIRTEMAVPA